MKQLLIAHDYAPFQGAESIQNTRLCKALAAIDVHTTVLTRTIKNGDLVQDEKNVDIIRARTYENNLLKGLTYVFARDYLHFPDTKWTWILPAVRKAEVLLNKETYDLVHSWSSPISSHLVALKLRRKHDFKWVAHFSDPWTDNPYVNYQSKHVKASNLNWEREVFEKADLLTFTSSETVSLIMKKYGDKYLNKVKVLPHTFDPQLVERFLTDTPLEPTDKMVFAHVGNFYGKRLPDDLIQGVRIACQEPEVKEKLLVKLVGRIDPKYKQMVSDLGLTENIAILGTIPYEDSQLEMARANVLLNIDAADDISVFLPSKLIEYLAYKKPIIALTPLQGTTARIMTESGHIVIENRKHQEIAQVMATICHQGTQTVAFNQDAYMAYHPKVVAEQLKEIMMTVRGVHE